MGTVRPKHMDKEVGIAMSKSDGNKKFKEGETWMDNSIESAKNFSGIRASPLKKVF